MRALPVLAIFLLGIAPVFGAQPPDTIETRTEAANRYAVVANMPKMLSDSLEAMSKNVPDKDRAQFLALAKKHIDPVAMQKLSIESMVKHFTTQELDALARFYGSPDGQSAVAKFGAYMADTIPLMQAEMTRIAQAIDEEMKQQKAQ